MIKSIRIQKRDGKFYFNGEVFETREEIETLVKEIFGDNKYSRDIEYSESGTGSVYVYSQEAEMLLYVKNKRKSKYYDGEIKCFNIKAFYQNLTDEQKDLIKECLFVGVEINVEYHFGDFGTGDAFENASLTYKKYDIYERNFISKTIDISDWGKNQLLSLIKIFNGRIKENSRPFQGLDRYFGTQDNQGVRIISKDLFEGNFGKIVHYNKENILNEMIKDIEAFRKELEVIVVK